MEQSDLSNDRRTFWPRVGPAGFVPDLGDDRPCAHCGYNLRGLAYDSACPECGALWGISPASERLPWDEGKRGFLAFVATVFIVLLRPRDLSGQIWAAEPIDGLAAVRFRRICIAVGTTFLTLLCVVLSGEVIGFGRAWYCIALDAMATLLWLNTFTHGAIHFFDDKGSGGARRRSMALARYVSAPMALMPLHLVLAPLHMRYLSTSWSTPNVSADTLPLLIAAHGAILLVQLIACGTAEAALLWQVVDISRPGASSIAIGDVLGRVLMGAIYFPGVPILMAVVANSIGRG